MKISITIPAQNFIIQGEDLDQTIEKFFIDKVSKGDINYYEEILCDICEQPEDDDGRCKCTNADSEI